MAFLDLCRLCGTDTRDMVRNAIFEGEERHNKYALKIAECLTLQVTEEDDLPKVMCSKCTRKLESLSDFRDEAYQTETHLLSMIHDLKKLKTELPDDSESWDLEIRSGDGGSDHTNQSIPELELQINKEENPIAQTPAHRYSTRQSKLKQPPVLANKDDLHSGSRRLELKKGAGKRPATKISSTKESVKEAPPTKRARQPKQATPPTSTASPPTSPASPPTYTVTASTPAPAPLKVNSRLTTANISSEECRWQHLSSCIDPKRQLAVQLQRLSVQQLLALKVPPDQIDLRCKNCQLKLADLDSYKSHLEQHKSTSSVEPPSCDEVLLNLHQEIQLIGCFENFLCSKCGNLYTSSDLERHMQTSHSSDQCDVSRDSFENSAGFTCSLCGNLVTHWAFFQMHLKLHESGTPDVFNCTHLECCHDKFSSIKLKEHNLLCHSDQASLDLLPVDL